jgi:hypothetical protein
MAVGIAGVGVRTSRGQATFGVQRHCGVGGYRVGGETMQAGRVGGRAIDQTPG